jgi:hypothetical protein
MILGSFWGHLALSWDRIGVIPESFEAILVKHCDHSEMILKQF